MRRATLAAVIALALLLAAALGYAAAVKSYQYTGTVTVDAPDLIAMLP